MFKVDGDLGFKVPGDLGFKVAGDLGFNVPGDPHTLPYLKKHFAACSSSLTAVLPSVRLELRPELLVIPTCPSPASLVLACSHRMRVSNLLGMHWLPFSLSGVRLRMPLSRNAGAFSILSPSVQGAPERNLSLTLERRAALLDDSTIHREGCSGPLVVEQHADSRGGGAH